MTPPETRAEGPPFDEPWQAQAFALTLALHHAGAFTWGEWAQALGAEIARARTADDGARYYEHWLGALERLAAERGFAAPAEMAARKAAWADAYRHTPHGHPVALSLTAD